MNKFEEVDAKDIKSGNLDSDKIVTQVGDSKITFTKDGFDIEAGSVMLDGKVSVK